jgi:hypothetical protein
VAATGIILCGGWWSAELGFANARLTGTDMRSVIGGDACSEFSQDLDGYRCSSFASMSCGVICSKCPGNTIEGVCVHARCWNCANGGGSQLKECAVGLETESCRTFGGSGVCGFESSRYCSWDAGEDRCYCQMPLDSSETPCARKDCADL